jgi:hypothetical protein
MKVSNGRRVSKLRGTPWATDGHGYTPILDSFLFPFSRMNWRSPRYENEKEIAANGRGCARISISSYSRSFAFIRGYTYEFAVSCRQKEIAANGRGCTRIEHFFLYPCASVSIRGPYRFVLGPGRKKKELGHGCTQMAGQENGPVAGGSQRERVRCRSTLGSCEIPETSRRPPLWCRTPPWPILLLPFWPCW